MSRWLWFLVCGFLGLLLLAAGYLVPIHLRAVDTLVLQRAGKRTPSLIDAGLDQLKQRRLGAAELALETALKEKLLRTESLALAITNAAAQHPDWQRWGGGEPHLEILFAKADESSIVKPDGAGQPSTNSLLPLTDWIIRLENRGMGLELLRTSQQPLVRELMDCRQLTNTVVFSPSGSSSGQALDAALSVCGVLAEEGHLSEGISNALTGLVADATRGGETEKLETVLLDFMSLGQRMNWGQIAVFAEKIDDVLTLHTLSAQIRQNETNLPLIFCAVVLSSKGSELAGYLREFDKTGLGDVSQSLKFGTGGLNELLSRKQRLYSSGLARQAADYQPVRDWQNFALDYCWKFPWPTLAVKWLLYLLSGLFTAAALRQAAPRGTKLEEPLRVPGLHVLREFLFAIGFLLLVLLLSEPFLAQDSQKAPPPFRVRSPFAGSLAANKTTAVQPTFMKNQSNLLTLLLFFVLQGLLYVACVIKLAEIRRQRVPARMKLKLLENEDHLFDAGLYLGFVGTIISLILASLKITELSLMAAYSSTSFGIIFVSFFKICHLRPARRRLLLEAEASDYPQASVTQPSLAVPS
jgi:hypothetical protein